MERRFVTREVFVRAEDLHGLIVTSLDEFGAWAGVDFDEALDLPLHQYTEWLERQFGKVRVLVESRPAKSDGATARR